MRRREHAVFRGRGRKQALLTPFFLSQHCPRSALGDARVIYECALGIGAHRWALGIGAHRWALACNIQSK